MFRNLSLGKKIGGGFGLVLILTALVGGLALWSMLKIDANTRTVNAANTILSDMKQARIHALYFIKDQGGIQGQQAVDALKQVIERSQAEAQRVETEATRNTFEQLARF